MIQQIVQERKPERRDDKKNEAETPAAKKKRLEQAAAFNAAKFAQIRTTMKVTVPQETLVPVPVQKQATESFSGEEKDHFRLPEGTVYRHIQIYSDSIVYSL